MSLLALLAATSPPGTPLPDTSVTATGPTWTDDSTSGGGAWTTPIETGVTYSPASGTATPGQVVTVTATAQTGYVLTGQASWTHTFPTAAAAIPYAFPTVAPYNVPVAAITPTYEGSGEGIHPGVVDFTAQHGIPAWNGHRYWMAMTPYADNKAAIENPSILASSDGYTWVVPAGLTNPIDTGPAGAGYNSDTDLVYDPDTDRLWCFWREHNYGDTSRPIGELLHCAWSTNGAAWTVIQEVLVSQVPGNAAQSMAFLSPAVVRRGLGDWCMVSMGRPAVGSSPRLWSATAPTGPWTEDGPVTFTWTGMNAQEVWHFGMTYFNGTYHALLDINGPTTQANYAATSTDAQAWNVAGATPVIAETSGWDTRPYRACLTPHEDGDKARVWYSAYGTTGWRTGYTQAPLTAWPSPP